jgi:hypothetical protein
VLNHILATNEGFYENYPLVFLQIADPSKEYNDKVSLEYEWDPKITSLRVGEYETIALNSDNGFEFVAAYSTKAYSRIESIINISRTTFICLVLSFAAIYFNRDA